MKVLYCHADTESDWNCAEWRCVIPMNALNTVPGDEARLIHLKEFGQSTPKAMEQCAWADVIVLQRNIVGLVIAAMEYWKSQGKCLIIDIDDDYRHMPSSVPTYQYWIMGQVQHPKTGKWLTVETKPVETLAWGIKLAHAVTTPSAIIREDWLTHNPNIFVLPNYPEMARYEGLAQPEIKKPKTIGWGGSLSHADSFKNSGVLTALSRVIERHKDMRLVIAGDSTIYYMQNMSVDHKSFLPWCEISNWPRMLATTIDIGIAPLWGRYDERRSWIKPLEYLLCGIPCVGSDLAPNRELEHRITLTTNKPREWEVALEEMIAHYPEHKARAVESSQVLRIYGAKANAQSIHNLYQSILESI